MTILSVPPSVVRPRFALPRYRTWQEALKDAVRDPAELCRLVELPDSVVGEARNAGGQFPLFVPRGYVARMRVGDARDPLLRQVLPIDAESQSVPGFVTDPVGDRAASRAAGMLHKYHGRVLLVMTGACAIHCRYCFRRHFPYDESPRSLEDWRPAIEEIAADTEIVEVILSGGDPLMLVDSVLGALVEELGAIEHVRRLRVHTRLPIVLPERVTDALLDILSGSRLMPIVVVHANHAQELDADVAGALGLLRRAGIVLLNQAVLLTGVNDTVEAQALLCERLVDLGVMPYYLHQLDRVAGAAHFEVPVAEGRRIVEALRGRLPGYAVPRYVHEVAGAVSKIEFV